MLLSFTGSIGNLPTAFLTVPSAPTVSWLDDHTGVIRPLPLMTPIVAIPSLPEAPKIQTLLYLFS